MGVVEEDIAKLLTIGLKLSIKNGILQMLANGGSLFGAVRQLL